MIEPTFHVVPKTKRKANIAAFILLDANVWISEQMLTSAIGQAFLHALAGMAGKIVLPEIVELEVLQLFQQ